MSIFKSAYLKLTLFYVLIVMIISVIFSVVLYQVSVREIGNGLNRQTRFLRNLPPEENSFLPLQNLDQIRSEQIETSNHHLYLNLIYWNILILVLSTFASYFLARRTLKPIEEAHLAQNRFTVDASHELRTPLSAMKSEIEVNLRDKNLKVSNARKIFQSNLEEIEKLESLSTALLKLARYQESYQIKFDLYSLSDIITSAYEKVEKSADKKNIEFVVKIPQGKIKGDKSSLVELFIILLDNAVKYSPKNSKIQIMSREHLGQIIIEIKDSGAGIKASDLPHIFDRFYRADSSRSKEKVDGYGLGLSIAKQITEFHKGSIDVESKIGHGSTFIVKLPVVKK